MRGEWYLDARVAAFLAHTALIVAFFLAIVLPAASGPFVWGCFTVPICIADLPALGLLNLIERWLLPGVDSDLRVFAASLIVLGGLQWVLVAQVVLALKRRRRPLDPNTCPKCRYDLTGNVSGVCPECGTAIEK
ncbi:MAG: hypothetical protein V1790_09060 [Planctomycetota bacterium]